VTIWKVKLTREAHEDFKKLDDSQKKAVIKQLVRLEHDPAYGKALVKKAGIDLTGFYKLYALRKKVYTLEQAVIKVIAIDKREDMEVYRIAAKRLKDHKS